MNKFKENSTVLVIGMGKVGSLVGLLLSKRFKVTGLDITKPHYDYELPFEIIQGDCSDELFLEKTLKDFQAVVSCMPYFLNLPIATIAHSIVFTILTLQKTCLQLKQLEI